MLQMNSKIQVPIRLPQVIARQRLHTALQRAIPHHKLILVSAPAGYGKTTLLSEWANSTDLPVAWLSVTGEEAGVERFLRYLVGAWQIAQPEIIDTPLGLLVGSYAPEISSILTTFIDTTDLVLRDLVFVFDDYHLVEEPAIQDAVAFLLEHLPPKVHFVISSRSKPSLPLARYRTRRQLFELEVEDLQFTRKETVDLLNQLASMNLTLEEISSLHNQTEGWIAGLHLAALHLRRGQHLLQNVQLVSGRHRFISDYLAQEVLNQLPVEMQDFLLKTSILNDLGAPLCEAVVERAGGQTMLEALERENLFIIPLDDQRQWYRYHSLFREFLQTELLQRLPGEINRLHNQAAHWYLTHDLPEPAFLHAVAGSSVELVVKIFNDFGNAKLLAGDLRVVEGWFKLLPEAWLSSYPVLNLLRAGFLAYIGDFDACLRCVNEAEQKLLSMEREDQGWQMARVTAVRCMMACQQNDLTMALFYAEKALKDLSENDPGFRPGIYASLGDAYRQHGHWEEAKECYLKVLAFTHSPAVRVQSAHVYGALADLALRQGQLRDADRYWKKALSVIEDQGLWSNYPLPVIGWVYIRMGEILYEWDLKDQAGEHITRGLERAEMGGDVRALIAGYLALGRLALSKGDIQAATASLEHVRPMVEQASFPDWISRFERLQLDLWLVQDMLATAVSWADAMLQPGVLEARPESEPARLAVARVQIMKRDIPTLKQSQGLLENLLAAADVEGRTGILIEALALKALLEWKLGNQPDAMTALEKSLRIAEREGYVRLFVDMGLPLARLLQEARSRSVMPDYVHRLLAAYDQDTSMPAVSVLTEPLTMREQQVLQLIAAGLTNREIAEQLYISHETVKKHVASISGKLGASNRTQAVARARELDLLDK